MEQKFWLDPNQIPIDLTLIYQVLGDPDDEQLRVYTVDSLNTNFPSPCFAIAERGPADMDDPLGTIEETLHRILDNGGSPNDVFRITGLVQEGNRNPDDDSDWFPIDLGYCLPGNIVSYETVPDEVADIFHFLTGQQLAQVKIALLEREVPLKDALRLTGYKYDAFQAAAIINAASDGIGEDVLDQIASPRFDYRQMMVLAKMLPALAEHGIPASPFLDPGWDADRMGAAFRLCEDLDYDSSFPYGSFDIGQLQNLHYALASHLVSMDELPMLARPELSPEQIMLGAAAIFQANQDPAGKDSALSIEHVARVLDPRYSPAQQEAMLCAMRGETPAASLSDGDFRSLFSPDVSPDKMSAIAYGLNHKKLDSFTVAHFARLERLSPRALMIVYDAASNEKVSGEAVKVLAETPGLSTAQMQKLLVEAEGGMRDTELAAAASSLAANSVLEPMEHGALGAEAKDMASSEHALSSLGDAAQVGRGELPGNVLK